MQFNRIIIQNDYHIVSLFENKFPFVNKIDLFYVIIFIIFAF